MALPGMVVLLAARAVLGPSVWIVDAHLRLPARPGLLPARLHDRSPRCGRSSTSTPHASSGLSDLRIIGRHVLSVVRAPIIIQTAIVAGHRDRDPVRAGVPRSRRHSVPTWGGMLNDAFTKIYKAPLLMLWPSLAIALTCIALTLLANAMRDVLERTVVVRRKRRRAVATRTGSIAAVTTSLSTRDGDLGDRDRHRRSSRAAAIIVHEDDAAQHGSTEIVLSITRPSRRLRPGRRLARSRSSTASRSTSARARSTASSASPARASRRPRSRCWACSPAAVTSPAARSTTRDASSTDASERVYDGIRGQRIGYIPQEPM